DVLAAGDDDVLGAIADLDVAAGVPDRHVAGVKPAARERVVGRGRAPDVLLHDGVAADEDLAQRRAVARDRFQRRRIGHHELALERSQYALTRLAHGSL